MHGMNDLWPKFKRILNLARPEWKVLITATGFLLVGSAMSLAYPQAVRILIDDVLAQGFSSIDRTALILLAIFAVQGVAVALRYYLFTVAGYRIVTRLQEHTYRTIMEQEIGFFDQRRTGELLSRLTSDTTVLQNAVSVNISMVLRNLAATIGGVALLFYSSPRLSLLMLVIIPPVSLGTVWYSRVIRRLSRQVQDELARANEHAEETLAGVRVVRAFAHEPMAGDGYRDALENAFAAHRQRTGSIAWFQGGLTFAGYGAIALVLWHGGHLVMDGRMTLGGLTSFLLYALIVAFSLGALGNLYADFVRSIGAADRLFQILDREAEIPLTGGLCPAECLGEIEFKDVTFAYPSRPDVLALAQVSLHIEPGQVVALVGRSGSGKSTIASLLMRFYDVGEGGIRVDGHALEALDASWLRRQIGVVPQEPTLFSTSIAENIGYGRIGSSREEIEQAARVANAHDFVTAFPDGYETEVGERGVRLSGGQKQRVAIARAVLKNPRILILDEATSALDAESEFQVKQALDRLMADRTTLVIAHRLSTVKDADRVVVLEAGRVVQVGNHASLMAEGGAYRDLIERQFLTMAERL